MIVPWLGSGGASSCEEDEEETSDDFVIALHKQTFVEKKETIYCFVGFTSSDDRLWTATAYMCCFVLDSGGGGCF